MLFLMAQVALTTLGGMAVLHSCQYSDAYNDITVDLYHGSYRACLISFYRFAEG